MSHGDYNIGIPCDLPNRGKVFCVGFGSEGDDLDDIGVFLDKFRVGFKNILCILSALLALTDKRAFRMTTKNRTSVPALAFILEGTADLKRLTNDLHIHRHGGGEKSGNTVFNDPARNGANGFRFTVTNVLAKIAVNVEIDQTGRYVATLGVNDLSIRRKLVRRKDALDYIGLENRKVFQYAVFQNDFSIYDRFHLRFSFLFGIRCLLRSLYHIKIGIAIRILIFCPIRQ